jgi:alpha-mannosidase
MEWLLYYVLVDSFMQLNNYQDKNKSRKGERMRVLLVLIVLCITIQIANAQTNVDKLVKAIESTFVVRINNWKINPEGTFTDWDAVELSDPQFNDEEWQKYRVNQRVTRPQCWLRATYNVPKEIGNRLVTGDLQLYVFMYDSGNVWIDGNHRGGWQWEEYFEIKDAKPGQKIILVVHAKTMHPMNMLWMSRANLCLAESLPIKELAEKFALSLKTGQKLLSADTYQRNARVKFDPGVDKSKSDPEQKAKLYNQLQDLAAEVDIKALKSGDYQKFFTTVEKVRGELKPFSDFVKQFTLHFVSNAHIDAAWLWREKETVEVCNRTFSTAVKLLDEFPELAYAQSQVCYYDWMEKYHPDLFTMMSKKIKKGNWELVGGMWVEPDCNLPSGESWMRQLLYGQRYFQKKFGKKAKYGWNPDSFGYNWNMPQFYQNVGIDAFITQKIGWNDSSVFPYRLFWWESPDGSRILALFPFNYINKIDNPHLFSDWLRQFEANTGLKNLIILFGIGDHGGGPSKKMLQRIADLDEIDIFPAIKFGSVDQYMTWLLQQDLSDVPVWHDELYLEFHRGTYTTQAKTKFYNRKNEVLLTNAEKLEALLSRLDRSEKSDLLEKAWKEVLFNQFHDILPGSSIHPVFRDSDERYEKAVRLGQHVQNMSLGSLVERINTADLPNGEPVVLFNTLAWDRKDVVRFALTAGGKKRFTVYDEKGDLIPSQQIQIDELQQEIIFVTDIPSMGYRVIGLKEGKSDITPANLKISDSILENEFFKIDINRKTGWIHQILDKRYNKEILKGEGNRLQFLEDKPSFWDAWNIGLTGVEYPSNLRSIEVIEKGPVRTVLRIKSDIRKPGTRGIYPTEDFPTSFVSQDIILYASLERIDFVTSVDWWEENTMLKVAFPVNVKNDVATYEIPYGTVERPTDLTKEENKGKWEVPAIRWADLSGDQYGVSLLNDAKYGYDIRDNVIRLSLLRSPVWPDPLADRGRHTINYALYPHEGGWRDAKTKKQGYEFNNPVLVLNTDRHDGQLPLSHSFVQLEPGNLIMTTIKLAEDSKNSWIIQWYETEGVQTKATVKLPFIPTRVVLSDFLESDGQEISTSGDEISIQTGKYAITTLKVRY